MLKITDRFYINANTNCYILQEKTTVQDENSKNYGQEVFKDLGYYTTIESCLRGIMKTKLREYISKQEERSIQDALNEIRKYNDQMEQFKFNI